MNVRRGFLYTGVFLVAAGGVILLAQAGSIDPESVARALDLWPLAVIGIGVGLVLRRTRAGVPGGLIAAALPGLLLGGMIVAAPDLPRLAAVCGDLRQDGAATRQGTFGAAASVDLSLACGELTVSTAPGSTWQLDAAGDPSRAIVSDAADRLSIRSANVRRPFGTFGLGDDWSLRLPTDTALDVRAEISAGKATFDLAGARLDGLSLDVNAGEARLDLTEASLPELVVHVNAGSAAVRLPAGGNLTATLEANAGALKVCSPAGLGLRVHGDASLGSITYNGLSRSGGAWASPDYASAPFHADLAVSASVGSVVINPEGGCL